MVQSLDLPVLSLAIPNIEKMDTTNTDNISCLWTVFSKCKNNLEHGKRLENLSWRVWYRERNTRQRNPPISPVPIQPSTKQDNHYFDNNKHTSSNSFKRLISSFDDKIKPPPSPLPSPSSHHTSLPNDIPQKKNEITSTHRVKKFFIRDDTDDESDESDDSDDEDSNTACNDQQTVLLPVDDNKPFVDHNNNIETNHVEQWQNATLTAAESAGMTQHLGQNNKRKYNTHLGFKASTAVGRKHQYKKKASFVASKHEHFMTHKASSKQDLKKLKLDGDNKMSLDFQKQKPISIVPKGPSLLSNMLMMNQSQDRLSTLKTPILSDEISCSMKECLAWEHRNNVLYPPPHPAILVSTEQLYDQTRVW